MRSRQMLIKLGGMRFPPLEAGCPDITLLTPEEQDRVSVLAKKGENTLEGHQTLIQCRPLAAWNGGFTTCDCLGIRYLTLTGSSLPYGVSLSTGSRKDGPPSKFQVG